MKSKPIKYIGGGRWAKTVLKELAESNPKIEIKWISTFNYKENKEYLKNHNLKNINLISAHHDLNCKYQKIFIASHSINHVRDFLNNIKQKVPIIIEKPLFSNIDDFKNLKNDTKKNIFINLEFFYSYFIEDFKNSIKKISKINSIDINWHDSLIEKRKNETKFSEIFSSIFLDQLLHVMSILKALGYYSEKIKLKDIYHNNESENGELKISCTYNNIDINISISRFNKNRRREIFINKDHLRLDFAGDPVIHEKNSKMKLININKRERPIRKTINSFIHNKNELHPLSILKIEPELKFCFDCESQFVKNIFKKLARNPYEKPQDYLTIPIFAYFSGIIYYREYSNKLNKSIIHYEKGSKGIELLFKWIEKFLIK